MPQAGDYLLTNAGFSKTGSPFISLQRGEEFFALAPLDTTLTLRFNKSQRYCIGWYDMTVGKEFACPDHHMVEEKYEQCPACQQRTGFNPAFYHATSVSKQQEERNQQPHILYLAHFGPNILKVGISYAARGNSRLFEQGARSAVILDAFPTALIARQYEARIAALPGIVETVQLRKKIETLARPYDASAGVHELTKTCAQINQALGTDFAATKIASFDSYYFPHGLPDLTESYDTGDQNMLSGKAIGMLGSLLFCRQQDTPVFLPIKKYVGYSVTLSYDEVPITLPARQISLF